MAGAAQPAYESSGKAGFGAMFGALPRAIGYYLVTVPKLAFNPKGTIRTAIEEQPLPPIEKWELAGWLLPGTVFSAAVGFVVTVIVQLVTGTLSIGSILPIVPAISALLGALIGGFVAHPILKWFVNFLKGSSDERSRTNYILLANAAVPLTVIPGALTALFFLIPVPFIAIAPVLLGAIASLISLYIAFAWFTHFDVAKWFRIVLMVLMVLTLLNGAWSSFGVVRGGVAGIGSGGSTSVTAGAELTDEQRAQIAQATRMAEQATADAQKTAEAAGGDAEKMKAAAEEAAAKAAEAMKAAGGDAKAVAEAQKAAAEAAEKAAESQKAAQEKAAEAQKAADEKSAKAAEKVEKAAEKVEKAADEKVEKAEKVEAPPVREVRGGGYGSFAQKRDQMEKAIAEDPTVLENPKFQTAYEKYLKARYDAVKAFAAKKPRQDPWRERLNERLKEAAIYRGARQALDEAYRALPH